MAASDHNPAAETVPGVIPNRHADAPRERDLYTCIHCGLCLNACPTYRELGVEMDSPRGRIYQMVQVATGQVQPGPAYLQHIDLCLGCRACESACPSGVPYGRLIEAARAEIVATQPQTRTERILRNVFFHRLLPSRAWLKTAGALLYLYEASGLRRLVQGSGVLRYFGKLGRIEHLAPPAEVPFYFDNIGKVFPAEGERRHRVALHAGCIQNLFFARLHEATVRVLQRNGCEVHVPEAQACCGALQAHAGEREVARRLARANIDAFLDRGFDAIISNTGGCGATLKEYHELLEHDETYRDKAKRFSELVKDVSEFLGSIELNLRMAPLDCTVTYQESCHLVHGQKVKTSPRAILRSIPGLRFVELPMADICCGSAGIYNAVHDELAGEILASKMAHVNRTGASVIASSNPGCMIQLRAGVAKHGAQQRVMHIVELLDEAYRKAAK
jgi:glycolate oxidase iron-sulfur subunit